MSADIQLSLSRLRLHSKSITTADDVITCWSVWKATELARLELYLNYAHASARSGKLDVAREVLFETVAHVSLEDPRPHLLLGQVAVALHDKKLVREAKTFLQFFQLGSWERQLDEDVRSNSPNFESVE